MLFDDLLTVIIIKSEYIQNLKKEGGLGKRIHGRVDRKTVLAIFKWSL